MKRALLTIAVATAAFVALMLLELRQPFAYARVRNLTHDALARTGRTTAPNPNLVFLAIDSDSVGLEEGLDLEESYNLSDESSPETRALRLMTQRWPWPREVYALVLNRLVEAGAKAVVFDLTFPTATEGDTPFRLALERHAAHVVIGSNFVGTSSRVVGAIRPSHTRPPDTLVPQSSPMDDRVGYTNFWPDEDDVVRRAQYRVGLEQVQGSEAGAETERYLSLGARGLVKAGFANCVPDSVEPQLFRYTGAPRVGFAPRSLFEIFVPEYWKRNYRGGEFFRDKIVLIGAEGNWQHDEHPTPFGAMPGPEIHLNAMNAALQGEFLRELPFAAIAAVTLLAAAISVLLSLVIRSPWLRLLGLVVLNAGACAVALFAFNRASLYLPIVAPVGELNAVILLGFISDLALERLEKTRFRRTLERYVSSNVVREMIAQPHGFQQSLGGVLRPATILFSDIRGYSTVSAQTNPQALVGQLNEYLSAMVDCVFRHGGTLDKFIGDAVMAVWGNVRSDGVREDTASAVRAALAMRNELARLNDGWRRRGLAQLRVGIAVHQGDVVVGNIGSPQRMEFTVIGDAVNVSWKLQELTKQVDCELVVSDHVAGLIVEEFDVRALGELTLRGHSEATKVFEVLGEIGASSSAKPALVQA